MSIDTTIQLLFKKLEERKAKVSELKAKIAASWITNGTFRLIGAPSVTNIQTAPIETLTECAAHVVILDNALSEAGTKLGRDTKFKVQGYTADQWFADFAKRLAAIEVREEESELAKLETRLNSVLSPEERRRIEVEMLAKELG